MLEAKTKTARSEPRFVFPVENVFACRLLKCYVSCLILSSFHLCNLDFLCVSTYVIYVFFFFLHLSCRSWSRRTSSWSRSWTNSATSSGRSTPCWLSEAEPHTHKYTHTCTHSHKTHLHTRGQEHVDITWTCDRVPQIGCGCTLQKKRGLGQYQHVSWRKTHKKTKEERREETNEGREVRQRPTTDAVGLGCRWSVLVKLLSTSRLIYISTMTLN